MNTPNWQHHSRKEQKRKLKPQALRDARRRRQALITKLKSSGPPPPGVPRTNASDHLYNNGGSSARPFSMYICRTCRLVSYI